MTDHLSVGMTQNEWEVFTGLLGSAAGVSETGRPRGFPPWASPDRAQAFALLVEHLPLLVQAADLEDAERWVNGSNPREVTAKDPRLSVIHMLSSHGRLLSPCAVKWSRWINQSAALKRSAIITSINQLH